MKYIISKEQYLEAKKHWKENPSSIILYNILRGFPAKRGFSPIQAQRKLDNGARPWGAYENQLWYARRKFTQPQQSKYNPERYEKDLEEYKQALKPFGLEYSQELFAKIKEILDES